jgi:TP901 family phage tail tape measure protein
MANDISVEISIEERAAIKALTTLTTNVKKFEGEATKGFRAADSAFKVFAGNLAARGAEKAIQFLTDSVVDSVQEFARFEKGLTAVAKTTNFSEKEISQFGRVINSLTKEIPATTDELLGIAEAAGQLGVSGIDNVSKFTETIAKLGRVSNLEGDFAATTLTRILNITGESVGSIDTLANVIVDLGNNFAASESEIAGMANEIARATQNYGVNAAESVALGAALKSLGVRAEESGGVINRSFQAIDKAIREGGEPLNDLVKLTGISRDEIAKAFGEDAIGVFQKFAAGLGRVGQQGGSIVNQLRTLGLEGVRVTSVLPALANNTDLFAEALNRANIQVKEGGALNKEFQAILDDTDTKITLFSTSVDDLQKSLFSKVAPAFNNVTDVLTAFNNSLTASLSGDRAAELRAEIQGLEATIKDVTETTGFFNGFLPEFAENLNNSFAEDRVKRMKAQIEAARAELASLNQEVVGTSERAEQATAPTQSESSETTGRAEIEMAENQKIIAQRQQLFATLEQLKLDQEVQEAERRLAQGELTAERREQEIQNVANFEMQKADAALMAQLEKNKNIKDAESKRLADEQAFAKRSIEIAQAEQREKQRLLELERQQEQIQLNAARGFLQAGLTLAKQGSREQKVLQTALALTSTYTAATQALASPPGPPVTIPLAASVVAQGLANVARINRQSFADGGVVDGFSGASAGNDNRVVNARSGEMFLNAQQQRNLFELANGNRDTENTMPKTLEITSIVQVDEREIARAVRNQKLEGFAV